MLDAMNGTIPMTNEVRVNLFNEFANNLEGMADQIRPHLPNLAERYLVYCGQRRERWTLEVDEICMRRFSQREYFFFTLWCVSEMQWPWENFWLEVVGTALAHPTKEEFESFGTVLIPAISTAWPLHHGWHAQNERLRIWTSGSILSSEITLTVMTQKICGLHRRPWFKKRR